MAARRMTMRKIREILRLRWSAGLSIRQIQASTKASVGAIQKLLARAHAHGLSWPLPASLDDDVALASLLYPGTDSRASDRHEMPDWAALHQELKRKGVTKQLLWEEYAERYPNRCYSYSQFCEHYRRWQARQRRSMRQTHKAGEKCFVDYCGQTVPIIDPHTGEIRNAEVFVGVLGASNYTFAEATWQQALPDWLGSHARMFEFFGGCPAMVIPDNLKSGISRACRYDPDVNASYQQLAAHYAVAVLPARPRTPKDKAKAEVGVQVVERWILVRLRRHTFFSLAELNQCIGALLVDLNARPFKRLPGNRRQAFERLDQPALQPLPRHPYEYVMIKTARVNIDYHVEHEDHHYSVPHELVGERVECHISQQIVRCYFKGKQVASHARGHRPGMTTVAAHTPVKHQKHHAWSPNRLEQWASDIGPNVLTWVRDRLTEKEHPEQAYRVCLGLLNLSRQYPVERIDAACRIANKHGMARLKQIKSILTSNRDQLPEHLAVDAGGELPQDHENIRGPRHYH
ncbi:MAG: IS21 family transposase [Gammaproteobacteria bacterium]|nr:IS21 family transposase [Gammaproteobacteria bacterium]